jgi:pimeloyl-ACP methyl ester carboxylesterase
VGRCIVEAVGKRGGETPRPLSSMRQQPGKGMVSPVARYQRGQAVIQRETLPIGDNGELHYSLFRGNTDAIRPTPLLICLHPGWVGELPPDHYGEEDLASLFKPSFGETGATIVSPDCPNGAWNNPASRDAILRLLEHLARRSDIDPTRVSLVGLSAGGWGIWYLLQGDGDRFSSAIVCATLPVVDPVDQFWDNIPKCGELLQSRVDEWLSGTPDVPIYIIHSHDDELLPYTEAQHAYQTLQRNWRQTEFVAIQGVGHFDVEGYVEPLKTSVPWLLGTWNIRQQER